VITLVLGGARSGKSEYAEALAAGTGEAVTFVATGTVTDADMGARIARHRLRRPAGWTTVEAGPDLPAAVRDLDGTVLVDSLGTWVALAPGFRADADGLCSALLDRPGRTIVVSEETGLGVHPETEVGRAFRDALGEVNRAVSRIASEAVLIVAGRPLALGPAPPGPGAGGA
jgi:adenosylcobinamide kinase / adenosylcobinamide-phosphate guanylyltransferase